jgi:hypothetical protein
VLDGLWFKVDSLCLMVYGLWFMVYGLLAIGFMAQSSGRKVQGFELIRGKGKP